MTQNNQGTLLFDDQAEADDDQMVGGAHETTPAGFFSNIPLPLLHTFSQLGGSSCCHLQVSLKGFINIPPPSVLASSSSSSAAAAPPHDHLYSPSSSTNPAAQTLLIPPTTTAHHDHHKQRQDTNITSNFAAAAPHLLSLQRSTANLWEWGEVNEYCLKNKRGHGDDDHHLGVSTIKMKKMKARRKVREPRFCFKTLSDVDVLDDGYKWRKYGQKVVKNTQHPRSYYRCTQDNCRVKKRVERLAEDPRMVITTYEGRHAHSPSHDNHLDQDSLITDPSSHLNHFFF